MTGFLESSTGKWDFACHTYCGNVFGAISQRFSSANALCFWVAALGILRVLTMMLLCLSYSKGTMPTRKELVWSKQKDKPEKRGQHTPDFTQLLSDT